MEVKNKLQVSCNYDVDKDLADIAFAPDSGNVAFSGGKSANCQDPLIDVAISYS